jgi:DNA-binding transcriptional LysR family regulator
MINPEWIRSFETLARLRHFTRTAKALGMTQPGVSQHLKKLEEELGSELVDRSDKSFRLLPAGEKFLAFVEDSKKSEALLRETLGKDSPVEGRCRYGSPGSLGLVAYDVLLEFGGRHPGLSLEFVVAPSLSVERSVEADELDVGWIHHLPRLAGVSSEKVAEERLLLVAPRAARLRSGSDWKALSHLGFVRHPDGFRLAERLLGANFPKHFEGAERLPSRSSVNQNNRILEPVARGLGFTVIHEITYLRSPVRKQLAVLELPRSVSDPVYRVQARGRRLPLRFETLDAKIRDSICSRLQGARR